MAPARVWIIGSDHWPRAYLRAELIERGYDAVGFAALSDAIRALALARTSLPALIVLDLHDQVLDPRPLAAILRQPAPIVALGGAVEWSDEQVRQLGWAERLRRPTTIGAIADTVDRLLTWPAVRR